MDKKEAEQVVRPGSQEKRLELPEQPERPEHAEREALRAIRIARLRKAIDNGTYRVSALDLADCMLERLDWQ